MTLAHENAALRRQVADLTAEREVHWSKVVLGHDRVGTLSEAEHGLLSDAVHAPEEEDPDLACACEPVYAAAAKIVTVRAEAAERALAARDEVIARVRESVEHIAMRHRTTWNGRCRECDLTVPKAGCPTLIAATSALAALDGPAPQPEEEACQMHGPGSVATPNADGVYEHGCTCPESDEPDCTCTHYIVDHSDPEPYHPENLDREGDPACPFHGTPPTTDAEEARTDGAPD